MDSSEIVCRIAQERYKNLLLWRNLWTILIFAFGSVVVIFLVMAIIFWLQKDFLPGALNILGMIVDGVAIFWVLARRNQAVEEEKEALEYVIQQCGDNETIEQFKEKLYLIGKLR